MHAPSRLPFDIDYDSALFAKRMFDSILLYHRVSQTNLMQTLILQIFQNTKRENLSFYVVTSTIASN